MKFTRLELNFAHLEYTSKQNGIPEIPHWKLVYSIIKGL